MIHAADLSTAREDRRAARSTIAKCLRRGRDTSRPSAGARRGDAAGQPGGFPVHTSEGRQVEEEWSLKAVRFSASWNPTGRTLHGYGMSIAHTGWAMRRSLRVVLEFALIGLAFSGYVRWPGRTPNPAPKQAKGAGRMLVKG
jgi:hypothetical protein